MREILRIYEMSAYATKSFDYPTSLEFYFHYGRNFFPISLPSSYFPPVSYLRHASFLSFLAIFRSLQFLPVLFAPYGRLMSSCLVY